MAKTMLTPPKVPEGQKRGTIFARLVYHSLPLSALYSFSYSGKLKSRSPMALRSDKPAEVTGCIAVCLTLNEALERVGAEVEQTPEVIRLIEFIKASQRGITR